MVQRLLFMQMAKDLDKANVFDLLSDISTGGTKVTQAELALLAGGSTIGTTAVAEVMVSLQTMVAR